MPGSGICKVVAEAVDVDEDDDEEDEAEADDPFAPTRGDEDDDGECLSAILLFFLNLHSERGVCVCL